MAEYLSTFERLLRKVRKSAVRTIGAGAVLAVTACSPASCEPPKPQTIPESKELLNCLLNGRPGDPNPDMLTVGEAVSIFPGTLEFLESGDVIVQPVVQLGQTSILAAQELVFDVGADGFQLVPLDRDQLKTARWRVSSSKGIPGEPGAMTKSDECSPGSITGRTHIHAQYVAFEQPAETPLTDQAPSNDQVITVPLSGADKDQYISIKQWPEGDVFGTRLPEAHIAQYRTGVPMYEVVVPVS